MALSSVWTTLPVELVSLIIEAKDNLRTLRHWRRVTRGNRPLSLTAYRRRWASLTIDGYDMIDSPQRMWDHKDHGQPQLESQIGDLVQGIDDLPGYKYAHFIEHLTLDFRFQVRSDLPQSILARGNRPYVNDLVYSLGMLIPEAKSVLELTHVGELYSIVWKAITTFPRLRALRVRSSGRECWYYKYDDELLNPISIPRLDFGLPRRLATTLRVLEIHTPSLVVAIRGLNILERLHLLAARGKWSGGSAFDGNDKLLAFIGAVFGPDQIPEDQSSEAGELYWPPKALKSLEIVGTESLEYVKTNLALDI